MAQEGVGWIVLGLTRRRFGREVRPGAEVDELGQLVGSSMQAVVLGKWSGGPIVKGAVPPEEVESAWSPRPIPGKPSGRLAAAGGQEVLSALGPRDQA